MHMADALISPIVGGSLLAVSTGLGVYSVKKIKKDMDEKKIPLMGVVGAFVFAAQMINFTIPGTGSSGHIGGGILLAVLLGPYAGFLAIASILLIQALIFGDGGLLAYGCNVFNLGFFTCFLAYPLIYKLITKNSLSAKKIFSGTVLASIIGLQLGSFSVVFQTLLSGKTELPFGTFVLLMQPIHLAIGIVEGLVTSSIVIFVWKSRPEIIEKASINESIGNISMKKVLTGLIAGILIVGGFLSWFASSNPDGLEWSMFKTSGQEELDSSSKVNDTLSIVQEKTAILPDYGFKENKNSDENIEELTESWPVVNAGTSFSGIIGGTITLLLIVLIGFTIRFIKNKKIHLKN